MRHLCLNQHQSGRHPYQKTFELEWSYYFLIWAATKYTLTCIEFMPGQGEGTHEHLFYFRCLNL
jgi:hypothetical protein